MTRLLSDMNAAHTRMLRNPVAFTDALAGAVGKAERGAHRYKQKSIAMCVGVAREVQKDFALFEILREAPCLQDNKKVQAATEHNFKKHVSFAVAARSFDGAEASENRIRVFGYVTDYFVEKDIPVLRIPERIEKMEGIEGVYKKIKMKKRETRAKTESAGSDNSERQSTKPHKREHEASKSAEALGERLTVEAILENYLLVKMPTNEDLERYLNGSARRGQRRRLDVVYNGADSNKLQVWEYVYGRIVNADLSSDEDNDNDEDYEDEDAA